MNNRYIIGVIGSGNMGEALINGLLNAKLVRPYEIIASSKTAKRRKFIERTYGVHSTSDNNLIVSSCDTIILAVKPQDMKKACFGISKSVSKTHLIISIAAGIDFAALRKLLGTKPKLIRVMPNIPAVIDKGISAIYCGPRIPERYKRFAHQIFQAIGSTVDVRNEKLMDTITGLSGTGPAYFFAMMEALEHAGIKHGLTPKVSRQLTIQTAIGSAVMAAETGLSPEELRKKVTSKKGTTWASMKYLTKMGFWNTIGGAVSSAIKRSKELKKINTSDI